MKKENVKAKVEEFRTRFNETDASGTVDKAKAYIQENPGKALLISVGAGFLLGLLLRSDDDGDDE